MQKTIHIFRHGLTDWNKLRRMQGHTNIPLNEEGQKQAQNLQTFFHENPVELFMSSDLQRALETAQIANAHLQLPLHTSPALREAFLGELEGLTITEAHEKYGKDSWELWTSLDPLHFNFAYPNGETAHQAIARFSKALENFCTNFSFTTAGVCTHGLIMRRFLHSLRPDLKEPLPIPNCVVYTIHWNPVAKQFSFSWTP